MPREAGYLAPTVSNRHTRTRSCAGTLRDRSPDEPSQHHDIDPILRIVEHAAVERHDGYTGVARNGTQIGIHPAVGSWVWMGSKITPRHKELGWFEQVAHLG